MSAPDRAELLVQHLSSLEVGPASDAAAGRELAQLEPTEAAHTLGVLVDRARESAAAGLALTIASRALMLAPEADLPYAVRGRIYDAAAEFGLTKVAALFVTEPPAQAVSEAASQTPDPVIGQLTLGHKKMLARQANPDRIARFAMEPDARIIRELLLNPRLTEGLVIRMAARRPARAEVLTEIWKSPRWTVRPSVRKALAMNPYTPPDVTLKLLPHLLAADLRAIAGDNALNGSVRESARRLCARKVPLKPSGL